MDNHRDPTPMLTLGATALENGDWQFQVWAPKAKTVDLRILSPRERVVRMNPEDRGYFRTVVEEINPEARYVYRLNNQAERPDPASRFQPEEVHQPSQIWNPEAFQWNDAGWRGLPLESYILYELHVGTYTPEDTFDAIILHLDDLKRLGVTVIELMPVAQFPGSRNWGYDGVFPFAVQQSYGGPSGLQRLVNACHQRELAVTLDVVYNHLGPEGNYLSEYGPYFTDRYRTPWGSAINFDGPQSDEVRRFFIENALYWLAEFHIDALRLDAIHGIVDPSARPFLGELSAAVHAFAQAQGRQIYLIAESNLNDTRVIRPQTLGGYGLDAQWNDDFHHALHTLLTGERAGYYADFGRISDLATAFQEGYVYSGQYSVFRKRRHGNSSRSLPARQFVVFAQNHDQVGNRALGDRLGQGVKTEGLKLAAGVTLLSPFIPLLFMGEEYGETAPFQYFTSHSDPKLIEAIRRGRLEEFAAFEWQGQIPDPQDEQTFLRSRLNHGLRSQEPHRTLWEFYQKLIAIRRTHPGLMNPSKERMEVMGFEQKKALAIRRWSDSGEALMIFNFSERPVTLNIALPEGDWDKELDSAEECWLGSGSALPAQFHSTGSSEFELSPRALAFFGRRR
ncbi:MAG TPA: malto-oligosyltrehalose trehalohydrolase [Terriglobia bacterium]|nr:malto-oligosyltrehalose trehalohydrolase [Terriglobia bacterium]